MINSNVDYKNDSNWAGNSTQKNNECQDKHESVESEYQVSKLLELLGWTTEDGRSINVFSVYWQLSQGWTANFPAL